MPRSRVVAHLCDTNAPACRHSDAERRRPATRREHLTQPPIGDALQHDTQQLHPDGGTIAQHLHRNSPSERNAPHATRRRRRHGHRRCARREPSVAC
jgi:hypothetical protein